MKILNVQQGTPEWHAERAKRFTASEAVAMMGASPYMRRDELLHMKYTGIVEEVSAEKQRLFDNGHATEAMQRPLIEKMIGEDLYPVTAVHDEFDYLLASFDGLTMMEDIIFEHKLWNEGLAEKVRTGEIEDDPRYFWQLEQQLLVSGAEKVIFVVSDGTADKREIFEYKPVRGRDEKLLAGWEQFKSDLAEYTPPKSETQAVGATVGDLPAITYQINGTSITTNTGAFADQAKQLVKMSQDCLYETDQDFADAEVRVKAFKAGEEKAKAVAEMIIGEITDINQARNELLELSEMMRKQRLADEKAVKAKKEEIRSGIIMESRSALAKHIASLDERIGDKLQMPEIRVDFAGAVKNKRTIDSLRSAANDELARAKIEANEIADHMESNFKALKEAAGDYMFLFNDIQMIIHKEREDLMNLAKQRIANHQEEERRREEERIRKQEEAKAQAEQEKAAEHAADEPEQADSASSVAENVARMPDRQHKNVAEEPCPLVVAAMAFCDTWNLPPEASMELTDIIESHLGLKRA